MRKQQFHHFARWGRVAAVLILAGSNVAAAPPASSPSNADALLLPPNFFPILPWCPINVLETPELDRQAGLASIAECHFTMAGFVTAKDLPACEKLGLPAIVRGDHQPDLGGAWDKTTDEQIDTYIKTLVERAHNSKAVLGYFLADEPSVSAFRHLGKAVLAVKKYAPGKLAYIDLYPSYAPVSALEAKDYTEYLEKFVEIVKPQFISYDNYMVQFSLDLQGRDLAAGYWRDLMEVRRIALKSDLPFWNIVACSQMDPKLPVPSPANMLFQAYTTLAAGGRSVSWFRYIDRNYAYSPVDNANHRTFTWPYLQMVNRQLKTIGPVMNHLKSTGVFFSSPPPVESFSVLPGRLVKEVHADAPVMVGEFISDEGVNHIMLVNLSLEKSTRCTFQTIDARKNMQMVSAENGELLPLNHESGVWLVAGQGVLIRVP